jgi:protein gp37
VKSKIEWTECTWNPFTGCTKVSAGCLNCYAEKMAKRLKAMGNPKYRNGFEFTVHRQFYDFPLHQKNPLTIFVNSMSDTFHENADNDDIFKLFHIMKMAPWHTFQVLTKRSRRAMDIADEISWSKNVWLGVTIESEDNLTRAEHLRKTSATVKFLSLEPLLEPLPNLDLEGIDWVIVGGESGPKSRPMEEEWVIEIKDRCIQANVPFFFKQWGGVNKKKTGRILRNKTWDELPI